MYRNIRTATRYNKYVPVSVINHFEFSSDIATDRNEITTTVMSPRYDGEILNYRYLPAEVSNTTVGRVKIETRLQ